MTRRRYRYRDAATGAYVSATHAKANPATTVREDDSRVADLEARVAALEADLDALAATLRTEHAPAPAEQAKPKPRRRC